MSLYDEEAARAGIKNLSTDVKMELNHHVRNGLMNIIAHVRLGGKLEDGVTDFIKRWEGLGL